MNQMFYNLFPILFTLFAAFYGWIAISILFRKKPVIVPSNLVTILMTAVYIPLILFQLTQYSADSRLGLWQFLTPVAFAFLLVFGVFLLRGFSVYGFGSDDFRQLLLLALGRLNTRSQEELGKIRLPDLGTELHVVYQERLGTALIKSKDQRKFDVRLLRKSLAAVVAEQDVQVKRVTAYFYLGFSVLMLGFSGFFVWMLVEKLA